MNKVWAGIYRLADPKITLASVASMIVGASVSYWHGPLAWGWLATTVLGIFFIEAAKNASGEIFDWDSGTDSAIKANERTPFSGGKRVIVDGILTRPQTVIAAWAFYVLGSAMGLIIVVFREPQVIWVGLFGVALAYFYHAPPAKLSSRGLGELAVAIAYGPVIASGTYLVQRNELDAAVWHASMPLGIAIMAFLWINEFPDARADAIAGKLTWIVRLGRRRAARVFAAIIVLEWLGLAALPLLGLPVTVLLGGIGLPLSAAAVWRLNRFAEEPQQIVPAQAWTLLAFVLMSIGIGAGFVLAGG